LDKHGKRFKTIKKRQ